jgi:hypothetical protein
LLTGLVEFKVLEFESLPAFEGEGTGRLRQEHYFFWTIFV